MLCLFKCFFLKCIKSVNGKELFIYLFSLLGAENSAYKTLQISWIRSQKNYNKKVQVSQKLYLKLQNRTESSSPMQATATVQLYNKTNRRLFKDI